MHVILYELTIHSLLIITKYNYNYSFDTNAMKIFYTSRTKW